MRKIIIVSVMGLLLFVALPLIFFNPRLWIEIYVHETVRNHGSLLYHAAHRWVVPYFEPDKSVPPSMLNALAGMLSDRDPKVRGEALTLVMYAADDKPENEKAFLAIPGIREKLGNLVTDPDAGTAADSLSLLGRMRDKENAALFREVLKTRFSDGQVVIAAIGALANTGDPDSLAEILPFVRDSRLRVSVEAINDISCYDDQRALDAMAEMLSSPGHECAAADAIMQFHGSFPKHDISAQMDPALLAVTRNAGIADRTRLLGAISDAQTKVEACENILLFPGADPPMSQVNAALTLGDMKSVAASAVPALEKVRDNPATIPYVRDAVEKALKDIRPQSPPP
ncbi:MAG TPA: HEAT repeat domain-containing protein [Chthoniobacteraceae bacterium]|nr:HEAT repeat domain-containing protein [Chthoniobacteraceae bacterium]